MNILVGLTSRSESKVALDRAIEEAELQGAQLHIVRVLSGGLGENRAAVRTWTEELAATVDQGQALVRELEERGISAKFRLEQESADPVRLLLDVADEIDADLIIIGIRRRSPVGKLVLGSVSQGILLGADCPVLAVKATRDET